MHIAASGVVVASMFLGKEYWEFFTAVRANHERYCARHGYRYIALDDAGLQHIPMGAWAQAESPQKRAKFALVRHLLDKGASYVFWTDADSLFVNQSKSLDFAIRLDRDLVISGDGTHMFNSGHFLIRNSSWSRLLLTRAIQNPFLSSRLVNADLGPYVAKLKAHIPCRTKAPVRIRPELSDIAHWISTIGCATGTNAGDDFACTSDNCVLVLLLGGAHSQPKENWPIIFFDLARETVTNEQATQAHAELARNIAAHVALLPQRALNAYMPPVLASTRDVEAAVRPDDLLVHVVYGKDKVGGGSLVRIGQDVTLLAAQIRLGVFKGYPSYELGVQAPNEQVGIDKFDATELPVLLQQYMTLPHIEKILHQHSLKRGPVTH